MHANPYMMMHGMRPATDAAGGPLIPMPQMMGLQQRPMQPMMMMQQQQQQGQVPRSQPAANAAQQAPPSLAFMPTSVMRKMTTATADRERDNQTPTEQSQHVERPQPMLPMRHMHGAFSSQINLVFFSFNIENSGFSCPSRSVHESHAAELHGCCRCHAVPSGCRQLLQLPSSSVRTSASYSR
jgi:hypothetical protein